MISKTKTKTKTKTKAKAPKPRKLRQLTSLGHIDDGHFWLSDSYAHTRDNFKVIDDIFGYYIAGDGYRAPVRIAPIYRASIWLRIPGGRQVITTHEVGAYYNPHNADQDDFFGEDQVANATAAAARLAIIAVEGAAARREAKTRKR